MELVDLWVTVEVKKLVAEVTLLGLLAEAESGPQKLEAKVRDASAPVTMENGRIAGLAPY